MDNNYNKIIEFALQEDLMTFIIKEYGIIWNYSLIIPSINFSNYLN